MIEGKFISKQAVTQEIANLSGLSDVKTKYTKVDLTIGCTLPADNSSATIRIHSDSELLAQKLSDAIHAVLEGK